MKVCTKCKVEQPLDCFSKHKLGKDGLRPQCKKCTSSATQSYYSKTSSKSRFRARHLIKKAKHRNPENFNLSVEFIEQKIEFGHCEVTGLPFVMEATETKIPHPFTPSLDRIDSSKHYTEDNVQVVCWIYNRAKGIDSPESVLLMADALVKIQKET